MNKELAQWNAECADLVKQIAQRNMPLTNIRVAATLLMNRKPKKKVVASSPDRGQAPETKKGK